MKLAIMQPYFAPYIGYFQLMNYVDTFVVYDNIQFTKKGWINRNRLLQHGRDELFSIPISKDSDFLDIKERKLANDFLDANKKTLRKIQELYKKSPFYNQVIDEIEKCFLFKSHDLFEFNLNSILIFNQLLKINTKIIISSEIDDQNHNLKGVDRVLHICKKLKATQYINPIGGAALYDKIHFKENDIILNFIQPSRIEYKQFDNEFVPWLSLIDILMFNSIEDVNTMLNCFELL